MKNAARLLNQSLQEESQTDEQLNMIAEDANREAGRAGDGASARSAASEGASIN